MSNWHRKKNKKFTLGHKKNKEREKERKWKKEKQNRENLRMNSNNNKVSFLYVFSPIFPKKISEKKAIILYMAMSYSIV